ncbi:MAG: chloride channel protein [Acidobacteriaceae bacterium]|nr:chloride channel protein [Acidobacteriaceae bacterium]
MGNTVSISNIGAASAVIRHAPGTPELRIDPSAAPAEFRLVLISVLSAGVGLLAGVVAFLLYRLIGVFTNLVFFHRLSADFTSPRLSHLGGWVILMPALGGIVVGLMAKYGSDKIRGHGIPEAMEAVLTNQSRIEPRVAILKPISAAIAIGTGGPFGAEGPIIQTGGALGSLVGQLIHTTAAERKVLLACGAAAGMSATFNTPIAGAVFALELLLFEFKARSFIPLVIASTLATAVHLRLLGRGPMFAVGAMSFDVPHALPFYALLGVVCGLAAVGFTKLLYWTEDQFEKLAVDQLWWPAIGALGLGIVAYFVPRVLGVGYDTIGDILNARLALGVLVLVMLAKTVALVVSLGSGTSGGLLAPMFMSGAALGGTFALILNRIFPSAHLSPGAFALVAMGAMFGAASRAAFALIVFAFEVTRDYNSVMPLMLAAVIAEGVAMLLLPNTTIMIEKLRRRGLNVTQNFEVDILEQVHVAETMDPHPQVVGASMRIKELADLIASHDPAVDRHQALLVVDDAGRLEAIITRGDILRALNRDPAGTATVLESGSSHLVVAYPDETLAQAANKALRYDVGRLPVVDRAHPGKILGYLGRPNIIAARLRRLQAEHYREPGWIGAGRTNHVPNGLATEKPIPRS